MTRANTELLTPEHVRSATFSVTRLGRRGLDEAEVSAFCQWVSDGLGRLLNDNSLLQGEILRLRSRLLEGKDKSGIQPEDAHVQAVYVLSKAQQTADRYVADAQEYSRELAEDARLRREEILSEAKVRASMLLEQAHASASKAAAEVVRATDDPLSASERHELQAELAYLRTFSDVCRTHLRAYLESLTRSIEEWDKAERSGALAARDSVHISQHVLCLTAGTRPCPARPTPGTPRSRGGLSNTESRPAGRPGRSCRSGLRGRRRLPVSLRERGG